MSNPWAPDPEILADHREALQRALGVAQKAGAPSHVLDNYRAEIERVERLLAEPPPEPRPLDDLSKQAIIHAFTKGVESHHAPGGAKRVLLEELTGLPLAVPNVPSGLPPDEVERLEAAAWVEMFSEWANTLAGRWKLHDPRLQAALGRVADEWGCSRDEAKLRLAGVGLLEAMASAGDPWSGRVGSGEGSGKVEAVPKEAGVIGQMKWLAQEALHRGIRALEDADERVHRPGGEADLPINPETGEDLLEAPTLSPQEAIVAEETARERLADIYEAARGKEGEKVHALLRHMHDGQDFTEARRRAAKDLGIKENAIDLTLARLRKRLGL